MDRTSVVVITHNRREQLRETLKHLVALPEQPPIFVVDNASADGTADLVAAEFPELRLIRLNRNLGAVGRNIAVREVTTPYVAFCDDDTAWQPGALARAAEVLDAHPGLGSVTGRCLVEPDLREDPITPELRYSPVPGPDWLPGPALLGVMAGLTMFRVRAFRDVGGFSSRMWLGGEEELLALDLAALGWRMCWREDVVIHHAPSKLRDPRRMARAGNPEHPVDVDVAPPVAFGVPPGSRGAGFRAPGPDDGRRGSRVPARPSLGAPRAGRGSRRGRARTAAAGRTTAQLGRAPVHRIAVSVR